MSETLLARLEAESAVRRLVGLYCDAVNRLDADAAGALFAPDCTVRIMDGPRIEGREAQIAGMRASFSAFDFLRMQCTVAAVDTEDDAGAGWARARLLVFEATRKKGADEIGLVWGTYEDRYARLAEGWRFHSRHYTLQLRTLVPAAKLQQAAPGAPAFDFAP